MKNNKILYISEFTFRTITILLISILIGIKLDEYASTKPLFIIIFSLLATSYLIIEFVKIGKDIK